MPEFFPLLILNARPAAGKSEIIHALGQIPAAERIARFHVGEMQIFDDFPMLWSWFEEDRLLEQVFHRPRLYTSKDRYFLHNDLWHLLIRRLALEYEKWQRDAAGSYTAIIEFSRGASHGGYRSAYPHLGEMILSRCACFYVQVSYAESLRKNRARYNPERPDSILEHGLSDEKMERLYKQDDWDMFTADDPAYLHVGAQRIPYISFQNEDDVTTAGGEALLGRVETAFNQLWQLYRPPAAV
jgi:hypothetical protein